MEDIRFLREEIAKMTGIPEDSLTATTSDALFAQAENILAKRRSTRDQFADWFEGKPSPEADPKKTTRDKFAEWVEVVLGVGKD